MKTATLAVLMSTALALTGCATPSRESGRWKEFAPPGGGFTVLMPGVPQQRTSTIDTVIGPIPDHTFILKDRHEGRTAAYVVSYSDYPAGHTKRFAPGAFLERTWQGAFGDARDRVVYKRNETRDGYAGIAFQIRGKSGSSSLVTGCCYLVNDRVYQLAAIMKAEQAASGDADRYLDSFHLGK